MLVEKEQKNVVTKEDIFLKARIISEGVQLQISEQDSPELYKLHDENKEKIMSHLTIPKKLDLKDPEMLIDLYAKFNMVDSGSVFRHYFILDDGVIMSSTNSGAVMVVGGGIAGMQAALDLADAGYYVYLVERSSSIGGMMSQLDKTFPTNDCAM